MARRKKEPGSTHRENIAGAAERLFERGGIEAATMNDIAKEAEAGYSKATLYVYSCPLFWAALTGLIQMSVNKEAYLKRAVNVSRQQFLEDSFERLYRLISTEGHS